MPELLLLSLGLMTLFGIPLITGGFARSMGRPFWKWFAIGCCLPVIAVGILFYLPDLTENQSKS